jgi:hypothetical protein
MGNSEVALPAFRTALAAVEREASPAWISLCLLGMAGVNLDAGDAGWDPPSLLAENRRR